jgi:hypothetical protein
VLLNCSGWSFESETAAHVFSYPERSKKGRAESTTPFVDSCLAILDSSLLSAMVLM